MVAHRGTSEAIAAIRALIRQMAKNAESRGIDFYRSQSQTASRDNIHDTAKANASFAFAFKFAAVGIGVTYTKSVQN